MRRNVTGTKRLARAANACGERAQVGPRLFGEGAKHVAGGIGHVRERRRLERPRNPFRIADAFNQPDTKPAKHGRAHTLGMRQRKKSGVTRPHRITHDIGAAEPEVIEQRAHILGHDGAVIGGRIIELGGFAVAAIIEGDDATPGASEGRHPARIDPVDLFVGGKAVDEHDRLALAFVEESNLHIVMHKTRHAATIVDPHADAQR